MLKALPRVSLKTLSYLAAAGLLAGVVALACSAKETPVTPPDNSSGGPVVKDDSGTVATRDSSTGVPDSATALEFRARADIATTTDGGVTGTATFVERNGVVTAEVSIQNGKPDGLHGLHIHAGSGCGYTLNDAGARVDGAVPGSAAGGHWNPSDAGHGDPMNPGAHHFGDMGNIQLVNGAGTKSLSSSEWTVQGTGGSSVVGHALVFHSGTDDLASQPVGDAGARQGCGVITAVP
jgi:superoxide dismutase, Cu-Zn family